MSSKTTGDDSPKIAIKNLVMLWPNNLATAKGLKLLLRFNLVLKKRI